MHKFAIKRFQAFGTFMSGNLLLLCLGLFCLGYFWALGIFCLCTQKYICVSNALTFFFCFINRKKKFWQQPVHNVFERLTDLVLKKRFSECFRSCTDAATCWWKGFVAWPDLFLLLFLLVRWHWEWPETAEKLEINAIRFALVQGWRVLNRGCFKHCFKLVIFLPFFLLFFSDWQFHQVIANLTQFWSGLILIKLPQMSNMSILEWVCSCMSCVHSELRNRLAPDKVGKLAFCRRFFNDKRIFRFLYFNLWYFWTTLLFFLVFDQTIHSVFVVFEFFQFSTYGSWLYVNVSWRADAKERFCLSNNFIGRRWQGYAM